VGRDADEGRDDEAGGYRLDVVERAEEADVGRVEADLLLGLAQRGRGQIRVRVGMVAAAGERDLALMMGQADSARRRRRAAGRARQRQSCRAARGRSDGVRRARP